MAADVERIVYVVDDDTAVRKALAMLLRSADLDVETFESGGAILEHAEALRPGCALVDVRMPGMNGLELQRELARRRVDLPVIVMTGHGEVAIAVQAMKAGAVDFVEKPFDDDHILSVIEAALVRAGKAYRRNQEIAEATALVDSLSKREREVLERLVAGRSNKLIAHDLDISPRTVEIYRANMMEKLGARTVSEAVRIAILSGLATKDEN